MTEIAIRDAAPADIPALHALIESAYRGEVSRAGWTTEADLLDGQRTDPDDLADILADPKQAMLTAWRDDDLVGCVLIADRGEGTGYFGMLSIRPTLQGGGWAAGSWRSRTSPSPTASARAASASPSSRSGRP